MKQLLLTVVISVLMIGAHGYGYWEGMRRGQERAILAGATYASTVCVATQLVQLRQMTRLIEARNRKPLVVTCPTRPSPSRAWSER